ncbi:MAG: endonuclease/exonuclease/phosphatase family protein [Acidobacteriota bacterium]
MNKNSLFLLVLFFLILIHGCKTNAEVEDIDDPVHSLEKVGKDDTLELVTWNMHNFPDNGSKSIDSYKLIIENLDVDLYAVQEIADTWSFDNLMVSLAEYDGVYSDDTYGTSYQKTGIIYKKDMITVLSRDQIYEERDYEFPRPPFVLKLRVSRNGYSNEFYLIVVHLKAYQGEEELDRRRGAVRLLKEFMDSEILSNEEKDYIIAGDWNDELIDPESENCFTLLMNDPDSYKFLTLEIAEDPVYSSYPSWGSLIDHILISGALFDEYNGGSTTTLLIDNRISGYFDNVSDHRPVISFFPVFTQ